MKVEKDESIKMFFKLLEEKLKDLKVMNYNFKNVYELYNNCCTCDSKTGKYYCYEEKIANMLKTKKGCDMFISLLKEVFGPNFFTNSKEELEALKKKNVATKEMLPKIFSFVGFINGKMINIPNSYEEFGTEFSKLISLSYDPGLSDSDKVKVMNTIITIENIIATRYKECYDSYHLQLDTIKILSDIINLYSKNKPILIENEERLIDILNNNISYEVKSSDKIVTNEDALFGDLFKLFKDEYNEYIKVRKVFALFTSVIKQLRGKDLSLAEKKLDQVSKAMLKKASDFTSDELVLLEYLLDSEAQDAWNMDSYEYYKAANCLSIDCTSYMHDNKIYKDEEYLNNIVDRISVIK